MEFFEIEPRGTQVAEWATVAVVNGRMNMRIQGAYEIELTKIQTEELVKWVESKIHTQ